MQVLSLVHSRRDVARSPNILFVDERGRRWRAYWICLWKTSFDFVFSATICITQEVINLYYRCRHGNSESILDLGWNVADSRKRSGSPN